MVRDRIYKDCPKGSEPTLKGKCHHCKPGFFKPESGPDLCQPWKDCKALGMEIIRSGNETLDSECLPVSTTEPNTTEGVTKDDIDDLLRSSRENEPGSLVPIIVPCVVIVVVLMVIAIMVIVCVTCRQPPCKRTHSNVENQAQPLQNSSSFSDSEDSMSGKNGKVPGRTGLPPLNMRKVSISESSCKTSPDSGISELQGLSNPFRVTENNGYRPELVSQTSVQSSQSCDYFPGK